ncbi:helix-turn-helix transcriptional regulator [Sorangium sp. So ce1036]|uniref:helix-turn-helix domain-containing protein n=1 Tax=Sorangium sp. So ce1036 TaxID=3133328 RepID=UPI003F0FC562
MHQLTKIQLGKRFSEGSRKLWLLMLKRKWTQRDLARALGKDHSVICRWLHGSRTPDRNSVALIYQVLGIGPTLWRKAPRKPFSPPDARGLV